MSELGQILDLWQRALAQRDEVCLATVVAVEGSAYRRPGARMLLTSSGLRAGTISGGCLEAEVTRKAWWLTEKGPSLQRYSSFFEDDGDMPYGLGCGGAVLVLLERGEPAHAALEALRRSVESRTPSVIVTRIGEADPGVELIVDASLQPVFARHPAEEAGSLARAALAAQQSQTRADYIAEFVAPPPALFLFGAGDDALPLVDLAVSLGWHVTVADSRAQLARAERFPRASAVLPLAEAFAAIGSRDAAVVMTHSYEQDREILRALLPRDLRYLGVLGPRRRTVHLVQALAPELGLSPDACFARLHSPVGLDLGAHSPATIALSIAAELQAVFAGVAPRPAPHLSPA